jgi:hypothetical protein
MNQHCVKWSGRGKSLQLPRTDLHSRTARLLRRGQLTLHRFTQHDRLSVSCSSRQDVVTVHGYTEKLDPNILAVQQDRFTQQDIPTTQYIGQVYFGGRH